MEIFLGPIILEKRIFFLIKQEKTVIKFFFLKMKWDELEKSKNKL